MGIYRLILASPRQPEAPRLVAEHIDPSWLKQRGLLLVRRPGLGAYVKGSERDIRRALVEILGRETPVDLEFKQVEKVV